MKTFYLIDGNAYIHRAYHALPPLTTSSGEQINAVYGFLRMILKLIKQNRPDYLAICFDFPGKTFRHMKFSEYKATRKEMDDALKSQIPIAKELVKLFDIATFEKEGYEADDLIATIVKEAQKNQKVDKIVIVTGDKDALQLVAQNINVFNEHKNIIYDIEKVKEKFGVYPNQLVDVFALAGDSTDNIPGVKGIGDKTAIKLIQEFSSLYNLLNNLDKLTGKLQERLKNQPEIALLSRELVKLNENAEIQFELEECSLKKIDYRKITPLMEKYEFNSLLTEIATQSGIAISENTYSDLSGEYKAVMSEVTLKELLEKRFSVYRDSASTYEGWCLLSIDLETTGLDPFKCNIVGIALSTKPHTGYYIPLNHSYLGCPKQLQEREVLELLKPILENEKIRKYGQNIKYDFEVLHRYGINLQGIYFDTSIASYCLNPTRKSHNLKSLATEFLSLRMTPIGSLIGKGKNETTIDRIEIEQVTNYSCADADVVLQLAEIMEKQLIEKKLHKLFYEIEMPLIDVLADMEISGIKVDIEYLKNLSDEFESDLNKLQKEIYNQAGYEFNINSSKQLAFILFEKLHLPHIRKTKTGFSTDEDVLTTLSAFHPLPKKLIEYRELQKLKSTYVDSLIALADEKTHRVHTSFNQTITATGRLSSTGPNLQNIPIRTETGRKIRRAFIPEKNFLFISADYSQIDLRVLASVSEDDALLEAFKEGKDIHSSTACEIFKLKPEEINPAPQPRPCTQERGQNAPDIYRGAGMTAHLRGGVNENYRRIAKTINFGIIYGMSAYGLAQELLISQEEAQKFIDDYFERYPKVKLWIDNTLEFARNTGYVTTLLGRVRYIPEINSTNTQVRNFAERIAVNTPIQGTSADIIKIAMINIYKKLKIKNAKCKMLIQVHDELLFELPEDELKEVTQLVKSEMENAVELKVPIVVDIKTGSNWRDMTGNENT